MAAALLLPGLLGPREPMPLPTPLYSPTTMGDGCATGRRELRFGWIDPGDDMPAPPGRDPAVCVAVYQLE